MWPWVGTRTRYPKWQSSTTASGRQSSFGRLPTGQLDPCCSLPIAKPLVSVDLGLVIREDVVAAVLSEDCNRAPRLADDEDRSVEQDFGVIHEFDPQHAGWKIEPGPGLFVNFLWLSTVVVSEFMRPSSLDLSCQCRNVVHRRDSSGMRTWAARCPPLQAANR